MVPLSLVEARGVVLEFCKSLYRKQACALQNSSVTAQKQFTGLFLLLRSTLPYSKINKKEAPYKMVPLSLVEARGVEPLSKNPFLPTSPSAVSLLVFPHHNAE